VRKGRGAERKTDQRDQKNMGCSWKRRVGLDVRHRDDERGTVKSYSVVAVMVDSCCMFHTNFDEWKLGKRAGHDGRCFDYLDYSGMVGNHWRLG
jgi:hypothetical protein